MTFQTGGSQKADTSVIAAYSLMTFPNVLYEELKIFSYGNHAEINSCVLLVDKKDGFWRRKGSRLRKRRIEGIREKEEEKGRRGGKETLFWRPHVMRFSLFTSMDTKSPPTVFIFSSIIILLFSHFGLHSQILYFHYFLSLLFPFLCFLFIMKCSSCLILFSSLLLFVFV